MRLRAKVAITRHLGITDEGANKMKGKDEREAARVGPTKDKIYAKVMASGLEPNRMVVRAIDYGYDAGLAARPEPPEPDGDLVTAAVNFCADNHGKILESYDDPPILAELMASFAQQHAARADAPADVSPCQHDGTVRYNTDRSTDCMKCDARDIHSVLTPAPTSPERQDSEWVSAYDDGYKTGAEAERERIAGELREILDASVPDYQGMAVREYIDKLEGAKDVD